MPENRNKNASSQCNILEYDAGQCVSSECAESQHVASGCANSHAISCTNFHANSSENSCVDSLKSSRADSCASSLPDDFPYKDIIDLPKPISTKHPQMKRIDRAAQFAPFAALTGLGELMKETENSAEEEN